MRWINLLGWIVFICFIFSSLGVMYFLVIIYKNEKYLHEYADKNHNAIVSKEEETEKFQKKINQLIHTPAKIGLILATLTMIFAILNNLLR